MTANKNIFQVKLFPRFFGKKNIFYSFYARLPNFRLSTALNMFYYHLKQTNWNLCIYHVSHSKMFRTNEAATCTLYTHRIIVSFTFARERDNLFLAFFFVGVCRCVVEYSAAEKKEKKNANQITFHLICSHRIILVVIMAIW